MSSSPNLVWQPSLLSIGEPVEFDRSFTRFRRIHVDPESWVDHAPEWVSGSDPLFEEILNGRRWQQRSRHMYDKRVLEPRLTTPWSLESGEPLEPSILEGIRLVLCDRYGREFDSVGFNLYRDGRDSVAWHAARSPNEIEHMSVARCSPGAPGQFNLRPQ